MFSYVLIFGIKGARQKPLLQFTSVDEANLVLPGQTLGGILSANPHNCQLLTISLPRLEKSVTFYSSDSIDELMRKAAIYTLACSLDCAFVHSIDPQENHFLVHIISDNKKDIHKLKAAIASYDKGSALSQN